MKTHDLLPYSKFIDENYTDISNTRCQEWALIFVEGGWQHVPFRSACALNGFKRVQTPKVKSAGLDESTLRLGNACSNRRDAKSRLLLIFLDP